MHIERVRQISSWEETQRERKRSRVKTEARGGKELPGCGSRGSLCADGVICRKRKRSKRLPVNWLPEVHCKWTAVSTVLKYDYELLRTRIISHVTKGLTSSLLKTRQTLGDECKHKERTKKRGRETDRQTDRQTDRWTYRQTDRQTEIGGRQWQREWGLVGDREGWVR